VKLLSWLVLLILFPAVACASPRKLRLVVLGDSISYGVGVERTFHYPDVVKGSWPQLMGQSLKATVYNYSIPGKTTEQGVIEARKVLPALKGKVDYVFILLGTNDFWKSDPVTTATNLFRIRNYALNAKAKVFVCSITPVYGDASFQQFINTVNGYTKAYSYGCDFSVLSPEEFSTDWPGHPNSLGAAVMAQIAVNALRGYP